MSITPTLAVTPEFKKYDVLNIDISQRVTTESTCIFCLQDDNKIITYQGSCNCHPFIHEECINEWNKRNLNKCPICLNKKEQDIIIPTSRIKLILMLLCFFCCISTICGPFIILGILFSVQHDINRIDHNTTQP